MKKFLTVLLVIAVMFTFSFGSAFAAVSNTDANLIKQAADYAKAALPEAVEKAYTAVVKGGTANTYISTAAWEAAAADIIDAYEDAIDVSMEAYLGGAALPAGWDAYDYVYAAGVLYTGYAYTDLAVEFAKDNDSAAIKAAKEQFRMDLVDAMSVYDKVDLAGLYSTTAPKTGKTYYEQAAEAIETAKASLNKYFINADGDIINVSATVAGIANDVNVVKGWIANGFAGNATLDVDAFKGVQAHNYEGTNVAEYYYVVGIPTIENVEAQDAVDAATIASLKAKIAANVAAYIADTNATAPTGYTKAQLADVYTEIYSFLAEEVPANAGLVGILNTFALKDLTAAAHWDNYVAAVDAVEALEVYADKYAAEKDADGEYVRDTDKIAEIVKAATLDKYAEVANLTDAKVDTTAFEDARADIAMLSIDAAAEKLAFDKEAKKADLADAMDAIINDYYDLEAAAVKAAYEAAYAKIDAAEKTSEFAAIETALNKDVAKIKKDSAVENLFASGKMATELDKQVDALKAYLTYANSGVKSYADEHIEYTEAYLATQVRDYYIANDVRTLAEMQAIEVVEAVAATLPTNADLAAAKAAADAAIKALPAKPVAADKAAFDAAFELAKAYNDMVEAATGTAGTTAIPAAKISALKSAIQADFQLAYAKADKNDKAALKAIADEVAALNKEVGATKLFTTEFVNPAASALAKIKDAEAAAVRKAINAIPFTVTEADTAIVKAARELYDAYVAEYTNYDLGAPTDLGYVADDFDVTALLRAEASLGLNEDPAASVEALKITARSTAKKGSITVKWSVVGDTDAVDGYEIWKSTKKNSGFKKAFTTTKQSYKNTKGLKKGTRYYYKVRAYANIDGVKYTSDWSNKAYRIAK